MTTQTIERRNIHSRIDDLPDFALPMVDEFLDFVRYKVWREEKRIPNAVTLTAMAEVERGEGEAISLEEFKAEIDALD